MVPTLRTFRKPKSPVTWSLQPPPQSARFRGYKDMDPKLIPQFEEGEREAIARKLLKAEGIKLKHYFVD
ncbi:hypothetical protein M378DRAFT_9059 [Amanita muscaria Koide BX008]|uniref:Uncharacterized protein n=1 Tax=Amanita muscaria (strain Koide BX008) TaxID=946122 RepID=A0A0C2XEA1_AMAMK|nr:hypothetical protein M378DRAFT_9059 [Amanita muscaria Koide BX008]